MERARFVQPSYKAILESKGRLHKDTPSMVVLGHLDRKLYPFVLALQEWQLPYGIMAHDVDIYGHRAHRTNDLIIGGTMLKGAKWVAANSHHTRSLLKMWGISDNKIMIVHPAGSEQVLRECADSYPIVNGSEYIY